MPDAPSSPPRYTPDDQASAYPVPIRERLQAEVTHYRRLLEELTHERRSYVNRYEQVRLERDRLQTSVFGLFQLSGERDLHRFCEQALELIARATGSELAVFMVEREVLALNTSALTFYRRCGDDDAAFIGQEIHLEKGFLTQLRLQGQIRHLPSGNMPKRLLESYRERYVKSAVAVPFLPLPWVAPIEPLSALEPGRSAPISPTPSGVQALENNPVAPPRPPAEANPFFPPGRALLYLEHSMRDSAYGELVPLIQEWTTFVSRWLMDHQRQQAEYQRLDHTTPWRKTDPFPELVGRSQALADVLRQLEVFQHHPLQVPVQLVGEPGTGRETLANLLHRLSPFANGPFAVMRCEQASSQHAQLLFGVDPDPVQPLGKAGMLERTRQGTLYLADLDQLSLSAQRLLLKALQDRRFGRLNSASRMRLETRIVCSTSRPLEDLAHRGQFLEELAEMLGIYVLALPPLRARLEDIPLLAQHFLTAYARQKGLLSLILSAGAMERLELRSWPGNVSELRAFLEDAASRAHGGVIEVAHLERPSPSAGWNPATGRNPTTAWNPGIWNAGVGNGNGHAGADAAGDLAGGLPHASGWNPASRPLLMTWDEALDECQRQLIQAAMARVGGNVKDAADLLQISRQHLNGRLNHLKLTHLRRQGDDGDNGSETMVGQPKGRAGNSNPKPL